MTPTLNSCICRYSAVLAFLALAASVFIPGCTQGNDNPAASPDVGISGPGSLTCSPMNSSDFLYATPLGNLNPPGHTLPSDHVYFYWVNPDHRTPGDWSVMRPVYAPGSGTVSWVYGPIPPGVDAKFMVRMTNTFSYYLGHIVPDSGIRVGAPIKAGQFVGTTSPQSYAIDLGIMNDEITLSGFALPPRYPYQTIHTDSPYKYFVQPLRDSLYAKVTRFGPDKDGKIDYDIPGTLAGGWFLKGLPTGEASANSDAWPRQLAFVYDMNTPGAVRISIGGILAMRGVYALFQNTPDPAAISISSGRIGLRLTSAFDFPNVVTGILAVQMLAADTIRVEAFSNAVADTMQFDAYASIYTR